MTSLKRPLGLLGTGLLSVVASGLTLHVTPAAAQGSVPDPQAIALSTLGEATPEPALSLPASVQVNPAIRPEISSSEGSTAESPTPIAPVQLAQVTPPQPQAKPTPLVTPTPAATPTASTPAATPSIRFISPASQDVLTKASTAVTLESPLDVPVELRVNGVLVDSKLIGRTETNRATKVVKQTWYGVVLQAGENTLTAHQAGNPTATASVVVLVPGQPTQMKISTVESRIEADGRSIATVQGQLLDKAGRPSQWNTTVTLDTNNGTFIGVDESDVQDGFQVEAVDGKFTAKLQSSLKSGVARIRAKTTDFEAFTQLQFVTALRPEPLLSGVLDVRFGARGTNFYNRFSDFLPSDRNNPYELNASAKVFGTAAVGEWLITGAVNTERPLNTNCGGRNNLFRALGSDCDYTQYPVYGDKSKTEVITPSSDHLFLRIERTSHVAGAGTDSFMWGDYETPEFSQSSQLFTAFSRQLHGFKANYNVGNLQMTGLYGNNVEGFQRDTIAPDGTRGFYFLSRRGVQPGSEQVYLELEEFNRPGTVLQREQLSQGRDYEIDYDRGSILFREPVLRTEVNSEGRILVRRIVVTYQFEGGGKASLYGARLRYHFNRTLSKEQWVGATYLRENRGNQNFELYGADALWSFGKDGKAIVEYAHSANSLDTVQRVSGSAYRAEVTSTLLKNVQGRAFWRTTDIGFSNTATTTFVPGQTRYGADLKARIFNTTSLQFSYDHEDNFGIAPKALTALEELINPGSAPQPGEKVDNSLTTIKAGVEQGIGKGKLTVDWVHRDRQDRLTNTTTRSDQISTKFTMPITKNVDFRAISDLTVSSEVDPLYPTRITAGVDWRVHPKLTLSLNQTYLSGGSYKNDLITSLDVQASHKFKTGTTVGGTVSVLGDQGMAGRLGVNHGFTLAPGLKLDLAYEHIFAAQFKGTAAGAQFSQPYAVGSGASALGLTPGDSFSIGLAYTNNPNWKASSKFDYRTSKAGTNLTFTADAAGKFTSSWTGLTSFQWASAANQGLEKLGDSMTLRVGLAYRNPKDDRWNALLRYEYRKNPSTIPDSILLGTGTGSTDHLLAAEALYAPNWRWEFYGKLGLRHSSTTLASDLLGTSTVTLAQARVTYRLGYRWDIAGEMRYIGQPTANYNEFGAVAEIGYYLNPNLRLSAGYAFGNVSDRDLGGSRSAGGAYVGFTVKVDNNLFKDFGFRKEVGTPKQQNKKENSKSEEASTESIPTTTSPTVPQTP